MVPLRKILFIFSLIMALFPLSGFAADEFPFEDNRFQGVYTTENLDRIIDAYNLFQDWYWTSQGNTEQDFHGRLECPGWTESSEKVHHLRFLPGWYGCRWGVHRINPEAPSKYGYGECYGFAQFIGYLLSGERNPQHKWRFYYSIQDAGGLKVGDILRVEYIWKDISYRHSAVVYAVRGEEVTFLQASGSSYNQISVDAGFSDGFYQDVRSIEELAHLPYLKISRSKQNTD